MRAPSPIAATLLVATLAAGCTSPPESDERPNIIIIFVDDMGYGDLGSYGAQGIATPHLDGMAAEGVRFSNFYTGNAVCTPSRAVLMTGRYGRRQLLDGTIGGVYFPGAVAGMGLEQVTMAEVLQESGYATSLVGKWHLGDQPEYMPNRQGFDHFYGLPYSHDMKPIALMDNETKLQDIEQLDQQKNLTGWYTDAIIRRMDEAGSEGKPFFVYYANNFPHVPLAASEQFAGTSPSCDELGLERGCGLYADVVAELDHSVGTILGELEARGLDDNTLVVFTSDNGPWLWKGRDAGSAGPFRHGKGTTFEGGFRVPTIARFKGRYQQGVVEDTPATMMDWLPTFAALAGVSEPLQHDGHDLGPLLSGTGPRDPAGGPFRFIYHRSDNQTPGAYREGNWKFKAAVEGGEALYAQFDHDDLLFDLEADPSEENDLAAQHPDKLAQLKAAMEALDAELAPQ